MYLLFQQNNTLTFGDVSFSLSEFRKIVPEYPALPKGYKERRYSIELGHSLFTNDDKEEKVEQRWEIAELWFASRYVYKAQLGKPESSVPGTIKSSVPNSEIVSILKEPDFDTRRSMLESYSLTTFELWKVIRQERNRMLVESDWTQLADAPLNMVEKEKFSVYRQNLRNMTVQGNPLEIRWATQPT